MHAKVFTDGQQKMQILTIAASVLAIGMAGRAAHGQTTNAPAVAADSGGTTNVTRLGNVTVFGRLDQARNLILPDLGATVYAVT
jgi:hypothetical protein